MSTLLSAQSISYQTTSAPLLEDISFTLKKGDRIGLVGHNGCGKSTLLNLLHGGIQANSGTITIASHCQLECVEQHLPQSLMHRSMIDAVLDRLPDMSESASAGVLNSSFPTWDSIHHIGH